MCTVVTVVTGVVVSVVVDVVIGGERAGAKAITRRGRVGYETLGHLGAFGPVMNPVGLCDRTCTECAIGAISGHGWIAGPDKIGGVWIVACVSGTTTRQRSRVGIGCANVAVGAGGAVVARIAGGFADVGAAARKLVA